MRRLEDRLAAVQSADPGTPDGKATLRDAVRAKVGVLVGAAAGRVAEDAPELADELPGAFARLLERAVERDPGCRGKVAIARAMHALDRWSDDVFERGVRHVQREPVWGGTEDTAAELRGIAGLAYAHFGRPDALDVLGELLADRERTARVAAAQGLGDAGHPDASALLRYKVLVGDDEPAVIAACCGSLLALAPAASVPFVARFLDDDTRGDVAALALGESRLDAAVPVLVRWCQDALADTRARVGYLALALLRAEPATAYLVDVLRDGDRADAIAAARALATFRDDPALAARVRAAADRKDVRAAFDG